MAWRVDPRRSSHVGPGVDYGYAYGGPGSLRLGSTRLSRKFFRYLGGPKKGETFAESWALFGPK